MPKRKKSMREMKGMGKRMGAGKRKPVKSAKAPRRMGSYGTRVR